MLIRKCTNTHNLEMNINNSNKRKKKKEVHIIVWYVVSLKRKEEEWNKYSRIRIQQLQHFVIFSNMKVKFHFDDYLYITGRNFGRLTRNYHIYHKERTVSVHSINVWNCLCSGNFPTNHGNDFEWMRKLFKLHG